MRPFTLPADSGWRRRRWRRRSGVEREWWKWWLGWRGSIGRPAVADGLFGRVCRIWNADHPARAFARVARHSRGRCLKGMHGGEFRKWGERGVRKRTLYDCAQHVCADGRGLDGRREEVATAAGVPACDYPGLDGTVGSIKRYGRRGGGGGGRAGGMKMRRRDCYDFVVWVVLNANGIVPLALRRVV